MTFSVLLTAEQPVLVQGLHRTRKRRGPVQRARIRNLNSDPASGARLATSPQRRPSEPPHAELRAMVSSGYLESLGYNYQPPTLDQVFREPDSVRQALGV